MKELNLTVIKGNEQLHKFNIKMGWVQLRSTIKYSK